MACVLLKKACGIAADDLGLFGLATAATCVVTSLYPLGLLLAVPPHYLSEQFGVEVSWTIHTWLMMPLAVGALAVGFRRLAQQLGLGRHRDWCMAGSVALSVLLAWAVYTDSGGIPAPAYVAGLNGAPISDVALEADYCLREGSECGATPRQARIDAVDRCLSVNGNLSDSFDRVKEYQALPDTKAQEPLKPQLAYLCALIGRATSNFTTPLGMPSFSYNHMRYVAWLLNWLLYACVLCFVISTALLALLASRLSGGDEAKEGATRILIALFLAWAIFALWLPFRLLASWKAWYYHFESIGSYGAFWVTFFFAIVTALILAYCYRVIQEGVSRATAMAGILGTIGVAFGAITAIKPEWIPMIFAVVNQWPAAIVVIAIILFVVVLVLLAVSMIAQPNSNLSRQVPLPSTAASDDLRD